jgi:putative DNA primase/helicase
MTEMIEQLKKDLAKAHAVQTWCLKSEAAPRIAAMVELARSEFGIPIQPEQLDKDPMLLNVLNGTIDLRTGELRPHKRENYLTKLCPVEYHADSPCPLWQQFLTEIFPVPGASKGNSGNADLINYVHRLMGYWLTGDTSEQAFDIFHGGGSNGKSTLLNTALAMMGQDYAIQAAEDLLIIKGTTHPTERADLFGKRLVASIEIDDGKRLAESLVKQLTGQDKIRARRMREDHWEFAPTHKLVLVVNHKPKIRGTDHAMWRRVRVVPFTATFTDDRKDKKLPDKLKAEQAGILAWCVRGCLAWQRDGLMVPDIVRTTTARYRAEQDLVEAFIQERCDTDRLEDIKAGKDRCHHRCRANAFYAAFRAWCESTGETAGMPTQRKIGEEIAAKGFEKDKSNGTWYFGLALKADKEEDDRDARMAF